MFLMVFCRAHLPFIAPDPCHLRLSIKRHHYPQPTPYAAAFRAARKPGTPPQTAAAIPWVPAGPGPPARRGAAARAPGPRGRRGGGPPGVGSWRAARPWRRRTACTSSGRAYAPTRCGWEPRGLKARQSCPGVFAGCRLHLGSFSRRRRWRQGAQERRPERGAGVGDLGQKARGSGRAERAQWGQGQGS